MSENLASAEHSELLFDLLYIRRGQICESRSLDAEALPAPTFEF
jgi:hypothetical protein